VKASRRAAVAVVVVTVLVAAILAWRALRIRSDATSERVTTEIRAIVLGPRPRPGPTEASFRETWDRVRTFYHDRRYRPAWCRGAAVTPQALRLLQALSGVDREGIDSSRYGYGALATETKALRGAGPLRPAAIGELGRWDVRMTHAFLLAAEDLLNGRVPHSALDPDWITKPKEVDPLDVLRQALRHDRIQAALADLAPRQPEYQRLRRALARYRDFRSRGEWPRVPRGDLRAGQHGPGVHLLRRRLAASGDLAADTSGDVFDRALERAVRAFQVRHGLESTGRVDAPTRAALNVSLPRRIRQIELNLERWRWLPVTLGEPDVEVNIPDFTLAVHDSGRTVMTMRVVVGGVEKQTPVFSDAITYLDLNPSWRLSKRILVNEVLPELDRDPDYLIKQHMTVCYFGGKDTLMVDASAVDWSRAPDEDFKYLVTQEPGPENPLGRIKIMCPNEYDVYLHDTPARGLFGLRRRALSHGCVRLEQPVALAQYLLGEQPERDSLETLIAQGSGRMIGLKKRVPIHFLYWTAWADSGDVVQFRDDLYGLDRRLDRALRGDSLATFVVNPPEADSLRYP
jgi:murein L,D-transpeptidase YcbB/YkuD